MLVVAGGDGAVMLDLVEKPFDEVAAFVGARAKSRRVETVIERADIGPGTLGGDLATQRITIVATIGEQNAFARQRVEHVLGALSIVGLAFRQLERDREPERIDEGVDFGRKPAAGAAHATTTATFFSPLAAC